MTKKYPSFKTVFECIYNSPKIYGSTHSAKTEEDFHRRCFMDELKEGDHVDAVVYWNTIGCWAKAKVVSMEEQEISVEYIDEPLNTRIFTSDSMEVAPAGSKQSKYQWRYDLGLGDEAQYVIGFKKWKKAKVLQILTESTILLEVDGE